VASVQLVAMWRSDGWVHGDVKPDNFGVDAAGTWFVLDVESVCKHGGIGKRVNALVKPVHTPKYAAPELLLPHPFVADTTDLYSVGVVLRACCDVRAAWCLWLCLCVPVLCGLGCNVGVLTDAGVPMSGGISL
jgi:serine/threonine protein kinase